MARGRISRFSSRDLRGFTTLAESGDAQALVAQLNEYFDHMVGIVFDNRGTLDKFIGDSVMAQWGGITTQGEKQDAINAVRSAMQMRKGLAELNARWLSQGRLELTFGIGINKGEAIVGNLGSSEKSEISAIGDAVNIASRLEGLTKEYQTDVLIGETVAEQVRDAFFPPPWDSRSRRARRGRCRSSPSSWSGRMEGRLPPGLPPTKRRCSSFEVAISPLQRRGFAPSSLLCPAIGSLNTI